jgi:hypothetical protein
VVGYILQREVFRLFNLFGRRPLLIFGIGYTDNWHGYDLHHKMAPSDLDENSYIMVIFEN